MKETNLCLKYSTGLVIHAATFCVWAYRYIVDSCIVHMKNFQNVTWSHNVVAIPMYLGYVYLYSAECYTGKLSGRAQKCFIAKLFHGHGI